MLEVRAMAGMSASLQYICVVFRVVVCLVCVCVFDLFVVLGVIEGKSSACTVRREREWKNASNMCMCMNE
jgi:hypothetical protein